MFRRRLRKRVNLARLSCAIGSFSRRVSAHISRARKSSAYRATPISSCKNNVSSLTARLLHLSSYNIASKAKNLKRSFSYSGALLGNNLPEEVRTTTSLDLLKRSTHSWFFEQYSHTANTLCKPVVEDFVFIFYVRLIFLTLYE